MFLLCGGGCDGDRSRGGAMFRLCTRSFAAVAGYASGGYGLILFCSMGYGNNSTYVKSARLQKTSGMKSYNGRL